MAVRSHGLLVVVAWKTGCAAPLRLTDLHLIHTSLECRRCPLCANTSRLKIISFSLSASIVRDVAIWRWCARAKGGLFQTFERVLKNRFLTRCQLVPVLIYFYFLFFFNFSRLQILDCLDVSLRHVLFLRTHVLRQVKKQSDWDGEKVKLWRWRLRGNRRRKERTAKHTLEPFEKCSNSDRQRVIQLEQWNWPWQCKCASEIVLDEPREEDTRRKFALSKKFVTC